MKMQKDLHKKDDGTGMTSHELVVAKHRSGHPIGTVFIPLYRL
jgi:replicative DNA helicase